MSMKRKGSNAERALMKLFWESGWPTMRAAGSGSAQYPCPDLLVGHNGRRLAIEVKITTSHRKYFSQQEIRELSYFAQQFGAEAWLAVKFTGHDWAFFTLEDLAKTRSQFVITVTDVDLKGLSFLELLEK